MTFDEIVGLIATDLNITAPTSLDRIGTHVNRRYRRVMNALGMNDVSRVEVEFALTAGQQDQLYDLSDPTIERIVSIWRPSDPTNNPSVYDKPLDFITFDEMKATVPTEDDPTLWTKVRVDSGSTAFRINSTIPNGFTVVIVGEEQTLDLDGAQIPAFPEAFHDMLVLGAKSDELRKMKDAASVSLARELEGNAQNPAATPGTFYGMLAELKLKMSLASFGNIVQGKYGATARKPSTRGSLTTL